MKKAKIFAAVVYYLFTISIGVLMALFLPYLLYYYSESVNYIQESLESGNYQDAISVVGGYYDDRYVLEEKFEGGGVVLFPAVTLQDGIDKDGNEVTDRYLKTSYAGFLYGAKEYWVTKTYDNLAKVIVTDLKGTTHNVAILNTDTDGNDSKDTVATIAQNNFLFLDFTKDAVCSIAKIEFIDCDGNVYQSFETSLNYSESFFADVNEFVEVYNQDYPQDEAEQEAVSKELTRIGNEFQAKSEHYQMSSDGVVKSNADKKSAIIVVVYFVCIYIIGDFLVGGRYILKFLRFLNRKVFKIQIKRKAPKYKEAFGHDYNCKITLQADVSEIENFDTSITVRYSNDNGPIEFVLLKANEYQQSLPVKAGEYVNLWVDIAPEYATKDLPDTLEAEGYQKTIQFKILKREKFKSEE